MTNVNTAIPAATARRLVILAFLLRGIFYCVEQPIWEGFDEWAHFGYVQSLAQHGHLPSRTEAVSDMLRRSVELAPLSASAAEYSRESLTHDAFWRLSTEERLTRERQLEGLSPSYRGTGSHQVLREYEAQQPPLYYLILAPVYLCLRHASLATQVLTLRFVSLLISAIGIVLCYKLALQIPASRRAAMPILVLVASWPAFLINVSRIGNDVLALTLGAAFMLSLFSIVLGAPKLRDWVVTGVLLGAALLAKSYMLALVPLLPVVALIEARRCRSWRSLPWKGLLVAFAFAGLVAGWWYTGNYRATGTLSGEQIDAAAAHVGFVGKLTAVRSIKWLSVLDAAATTHIWTGGWSFLTVRSWMDRTFECLAIIAGLGLVVLAAHISRKSYCRGFGSRDACFFLVVCAYALFCSALVYFAIVVYITYGTSVVLGWYLYAIAGVEAVLLASGFTGLVGTRRAAGCVAAVAVLASAFDLYTVHFVSVPYYTGLTAHLPSGFVASFHPLATLRGIGLSGVFARLAVGKPAALAPPVLITLWTGYVCATSGLFAYSFATMKRAFSCQREQQRAHSQAV
jgi:hypothetical protein